MKHNEHLVEITAAYMNRLETLPSETLLAEARAFRARWLTSGGKRGEKLRLHQRAREVIVCLRESEEPELPLG